MSADEAAQRRVVEHLHEITRLASEVAAAGGPEDEFGVRNRAVELAAMAQTLVWVVDPQAADWTLELYDRVRSDEPAV